MHARFGLGSGLACHECEPERNACKGCGGGGGHLHTMTLGPLRPPEPMPSDGIQGPSNSNKKQVAIAPAGGLCCMLGMLAVFWIKPKVDTQTRCFRTEAVITPGSIMNGLRRTQPLRWPRFRNTFPPPSHTTHRHRHRHMFEATQTPDQVRCRD